MMGICNKVVGRLLIISKSSDYLALYGFIVCNVSNYYDGEKDRIIYEVLLLGLYLCLKVALG